MWFLQFLDIVFLRVRTYLVRLIFAIVIQNFITGMQIKK